MGPAQAAARVWAAPHVRRVLDGRTWPRGWTRRGGKRGDWAGGGGEDRTGGSETGGAEGAEADGGVERKARRNSGRGKTNSGNGPRSGWPVRGRAGEGEKTRPDLEKYERWKQYKQ